MFLINESCDYSQQRQQGTQILESTSMGNGRKQVTIKTILQTCDELNKNNRIYPKTLLQTAVHEIKPMIENNTLVGELDHPVPTGVSETDSYRHFVVLYDRASHIIKDVYFEGDKVMGIVKTASTQKGYDAAGLISDGVPVGFSLRAMGESETMPNGTTMIKAPLSIVTWDMVSNPSHAKARMQSIVKENVSSFTPQTKALMEGTLGSIYLDRSSILNSAFTESKYKKLSSNERFKALMEHIDILTGNKSKEALSEENAVRAISRLFENYLGESFDIDESYLDFENSGTIVHNRLLDYLDEFIDPKKSSRDTRDIALFNKHFKAGVKREY